MTPFTPTSPLVYWDITIDNTNNVSSQNISVKSSQLFHESIYLSVHVPGTLEKTNYLDYM